MSTDARSASQRRAGDVSSLPLRGATAAAAAAAAASPSLSASPAPSTTRLHSHARRWNNNGGSSHPPPSAAASSRMQYRSRPVSVAVDPISLIISECISITSAIQKYARSQHLSVAAILGGGAASYKLGGGPPPDGGAAGRRHGAGGGSAGGSGAATPTAVAGSPQTAIAGRRGPSTGPGGKRGTVSFGGSAAAGGGAADGEFASANRWGLRGKKGKSMADNPLISGFGRLRQELARVKDIRSFDSLMLLYPFLQIIQTKGTAAPITILALRAVRKFLAYGFVSPESPRFSLGMQALAQAITHCQFDISDGAQEEVVLLMILNLMEDMLSGPGGDILSDESVCDMMGRGLTICSRPRFSEVLRQTAEATMVRMCQIIFEDLKHLEEEAGEEADALDRQTNADMDSVKMVPGADGGHAGIPPAAAPVPVGGADNQDRASTDSNGANPSALPEEAKPADAAASTTADASAPEEAATPTPAADAAGGAVPDRPSTDASTDASDQKSTASSANTEEETDSVDLRPYSLPSVRELFRVLVDFLEPSPRKQQPDTMRVMALRIIHVALEVAGPSIARHPALASVAQDRLCCYLFQLVRSDNMAILQESLIVASTLLSTCRGVLKLQQELYLSYLISCLHPAVGIPREPSIDPSLYEGIPQAPKLVKTTAAPLQAGVEGGGGGGVGGGGGGAGGGIGIGGTRKPEARQAMVENIGVLARMPTYMIELFVNYDCDTDRADLCEDLVGLLSRNALPDAATWSTTSVPPLCLDALLRFVQFMAQRLDDAPVYEGYPHPAQLRAARARKKAIIRGVQRFNENPKAGLALLQEAGILDDARSPLSVARFLKGTTRVSKRVLGEFLSKKGNEAILAAFLALFDFAGKRVDEALRMMLETFRLPGESPLIERIVNCFAEQYCAGAMPADDVADKDAVYILTYAIIMLNTDQHNPNLRAEKRMTVTDFARNLRGQNGGRDFAAAYLQDIFDSIKGNEIILPEEHDNKHAFDYAWRAVLQQTAAAGPLRATDTNVYDADLFATTWRPIVATLSYVFLSATDDTVFSRVIQGFDECARIAARFGNTAALDQIVYCLAHMSTLAQVVACNTGLNTEMQVGDDRVMVSALAVKLGRNFRAQLAALVLFRVVTENEPVVRQGWRHLARIWLNLFQNSLIPAYFAGAAPLLQSLPPIPLQSPGQVIDRGAKPADGGGFFSAFTSYISSYAADDPPEPSDEEVESTLCAIDCVQSCRVGDVFAHVAGLTGASLEALVDALLAQMPEDSDDDAGVVIKVKAENVPPAAAAAQAAQAAQAAAQRAAKAAGAAGGPGGGPGGSGGGGSGAPAYDPVPVYVLEFCTVLALRDATTLRLVGKRVVAALQGVLRDVARYHALVVGRAAYYLFSLLRASYAAEDEGATGGSGDKADGADGANGANGANGHDDDDVVVVRAPVLLHAVSSFPKATLQATAEPVLAGLQLCIGAGGPLRSEMMTSPDLWAVLGTLAHHEPSAGTVFAILQSGLGGPRPAILADNYEAAIVLCNAFASAASVGARAEQQTDRRNRRASGRAAAKPDKASDNAAVQRGVQAVNMLYGLTARIPHLIKQSHLETNEAWSAYWLPLFRALTNQCTNPCREVRHLAFSSLQRSLLAPELTSSDHREWTAIFGEVLFPLILQLLRPEVYLTDRDGMSETRVQAASLLCKVFLQYLVLLSAWDGMLDLWLRIIDILDRLMNSGQGDSLEEAVPENLKNVLLFMASSGYLVAPSRQGSGGGSSGSEALWVETWKRIDRFLPDLKSELALEGPLEGAAAEEAGGDGGEEEKPAEGAEAASGTGEKAASG